MAPKNFEESGGLFISGLFWEILKKYSEENRLALELPGIRPGKNMPLQAFNNLFSGVALASGDPDFGLHLAEKYCTALSWGLLAGLLANSASIGHALDNLCRYHSLMGDYLGLRVDRAAFRSALILSPAQGTGGGRHFMEAMMCSVVLNLRRLADNRLRCAEVRFSHPGPNSMSEHRRLFGCACRFGQKTNAIVFATPELEHPVFMADTMLLHKLERIAREAQKELSAGEWTRRVSQSIHNRLQSGQPCTLAATAGELAVSRRLLQGKLKMEKGTFRQLLDQVRKSMALAYLEDSDFSLFDIAYLLGFEEQSAFNHAFRRWTGSHPGKYRKRTSSTAK